MKNPAFCAAPRSTGRRSKAVPRRCHVVGGLVAKSMTKISYSGYRFPPEIIHQAIWLYLRFTLSFRDVEDLLAERGIVVSYETVRRWVNHFGPIIAAELRKRRPKPHSIWHLDEVYLKIDGRMVYLWRAVDAEGEVLDVLVQSKRNKHAALKLMRKLLRKYAVAPERLVTDDLRSYRAATLDLGIDHRPSFWGPNDDMRVAGPPVHALPKVRASLGGRTGCRGDSAAVSFWAPQSGIVTSRVAPSRDISNSALWWGAAAFTAAVRSANELTGVPSTESNTSPSTIPALAAAPPARMLRTIRPRSEPILSAVADPGETGRNTTPRRVPWCATREGGPNGLGGVGGLGGGLTIAAPTGFWGVLLQPLSFISVRRPPR